MDNNFSRIEPEIRNRFPNAIERERKSDYLEDKSRIQWGEVKKTVIT
ncbi:hypothetical protein P872_08765 [Rhodonellum psychrophilum GCM71 = DSM 17998]|uniref:Uncharacterized protein n=1 Tax=Rhodonellum psychrophilum GCM71 = DSM 17998 TaxID=1123057 RepID=U5BNE0_9BACT|nr:hypothetical protein P872_08765 [Rhodonellum psychrophilum GCM71 = DSM 17998]